MMGNVSLKVISVVICFQIVSLVRSITSQWKYITLVIQL